MTKAVNLAAVGTNANSGGTLITSGTAVASTSGTSIDFTNPMPAGTTKRITVMFNGVSSSAVVGMVLQLGTTSGIETTGYNGQCGNRASDFNNSAYAGLLVTMPGRPIVSAYYGTAVLNLLSSSTWTQIGILSADTGDAAPNFSSGGKTLAGALTTVRISMTAAGNFDAGTINVLWE